MHGKLYSHFPGTARALVALVSALAIFGLAPSTRAAELITNGGFETGNFTGWTAVNSTNGWRLWAVSSGLHGGDDGTVYTPVPTAALPFAGSFSAWNGATGGAGQSFTLTQTISIPANQNATFRWADRYQMNHTQFCSTGCGTQVYAVEILNTSNVLLQTVYTVSTPTNTNSNTGWVSHAANISAFQGQTIRIRFRTTSQVTLQGPGQLDIDNVSVQTFNQGTAADVAVSGRVVNLAGMGVRGATVVFVGTNGKRYTAIANSFGYFTIAGVPAGETYVANVSSRGLVFAPRAVTVTDQLTGVDFSAQ
jgi:hypothetical protein